MIVQREGQLGRFNSRKVLVDGQWFDSKKEAQYYLDLMLQVKAGTLRSVERQPAFALEVNGVKVAPRPYRADFRVVESDGTVRILDVKGYDEPYCKLRRKLAEAIHGIVVECPGLKAKKPRKLKK